MKNITYDAIVVGNGISGGWASKELCEKGLKTLVLERGRNVEHNKDYDDMDKSIKDIVLSAYLSSEVGMTQLFDYHPVPGKYDGCTTKKPW